MAAQPCGVNKAASEVSATGAAPAAICGSMQAAAAVLRQERLPAGGDGYDCDGAKDFGAVALVRLRFSSRPEWLKPGCRLIVRERNEGHVAAAGFIDKLHE